MRIRRAARALVTLGCLSALTCVAPSGASAQPPAAKSTATAGASAKPDTKPKPGDAVHHSVPVAPKAVPRAGGKGPVKAAPNAKPPKKGPFGKRPRKPGEGGEPDEATRRIIAGTAGRSVRESPELRAIRELDLALFPSMAPSSGPPWIAEGTPLIDRGEPRVHATGMPPSTLLAAAPAAEGAPADLSWLKTLVMPDIPVRWDARVIRYLEYYKNNARARSMVEGWVRRSGKYGASIRRVLHEQGLPEDIVWLALVESGFDPTISSPAGAAGLWQFMPEGARIYGLTVDRWIDERLDPERSTVAAARYLADLHTRFGNWELAFAAYNMGYGGLLSAIRKYNTNDFWELSRHESGMPYETALYVPKIISMAIVARNRAAFGCADVEPDQAVNFDKVAVSSGVALRSVALAAGVSTDTLEELNPQWLAGRAPPLAPGAKADATWTLRVPVGAAPRAAKSLSKFTDAEPRVERYVVRWGESLEDIAVRRRTTRGMLQSLNGIRREEVVRPGMLLFIPATPGIGAAAAAEGANASSAVKPVVVVPAQVFSQPDRERLFYRVIPGDTLRDVAMLFSVTSDEVCRWNTLDPSAALHDGMTLQIYAPKGQDLHDVLVLKEKDADVLRAGTPEFFAHFEAQRGRKRLELVAKDGDTWRSLASRYGLTMGQMERINQRARSSPLSAGDKLVVYVANGRVKDVAPAREAKPDEKPEDAVAVAKPTSDEVVASAAVDEGVKPAGLRKPIVPEDVEPASLSPSPGR